MPWLDLLPTVWTGGFEASTMVMCDGRRVDVAQASGHDRHFATDYDLLLKAGIRSVRESLRWHRIEARPGRYDAGDFLPRLRALSERGMRAVWSLTQFGVPDWADIWSDEFPGMFAAYAAFVAQTLRQETDEVPIWSPVNEISYWSWAGGTMGHFSPCTTGRGDDLKRQLVRAAIAAARALRAVDGRARLLHIDPLVNVLPDHGPADTMTACGVFDAWDMVSGRLCPELGGAPELLDIVGVNFYPHNQRFADGSQVPPEDPAFVPFHCLARLVHQRYRRPIFVAETGREGPDEGRWLAYMGRETELLVRDAELVGICLYPVMDYPGWADDRHCQCGLIACDETWQRRHLRPQALTRLSH